MNQIGKEMKIYTQKHMGGSLINSINKENILERENLFFQQLSREKLSGC